MTQRLSNKFRLQSRRPEDLESRSMLSGHPLSAAIAAPSKNVPAFVSGLKSSVSSSQETHLSAALSDPAGGTASGSANYESETEHGTTKTSLVVSVKGATPGTPLDVSITTASGTTSLGTITPDANGNGKLVVKTGLPTDVATDGTTTVAVGTLTGALAVKTGGGGHDDHGDANETHLGAKLTNSDTASTATAAVSFESETEKGVAKSKLSVYVKGGTPLGSYDVSITTASGTALLGTISTDANGNGKLVIKTGLPTDIVAGSTVTVGTTFSGTLGAKK